MAKRIVQGYLFHDTTGQFPEREDTVCQIERRVTAREGVGELLGEGPAFWVYFGDDPDNIYFAYGKQLSPWFPTD